MTHDSGTHNAPVSKIRSYEPDVSDSLRALIDCGILTLGLLIAITRRKQRC